MQAIPDQIAAHLAPHQIRLQARVEKIVGKTIHLENGETIAASKIVLATDATATAHLLGETPHTLFNATDCLYFTCDQPFHIFDKPYLIINANQAELIDHLVILSAFAPAYAPAGKTLISVSTVGKNPYAEQDLIEKVQQELRQWFGQQYAWQHLRSYRLPEALPQYIDPSPAYTSLQVNDFLYRCGDYTAYPSLNAAMKTGQAVAEMLTK